jgi:hypothetical protein
MCGLTICRKMCSHLVKNEFGVSKRTDQVKCRSRISNTAFRTDGTVIDNANRQSNFSFPLEHSLPLFRFFWPRFFDDNLCPDHVRDQLGNFGKRTWLCPVSHAPGGCLGHTMHRCPGKGYVVMSRRHGSYKLMASVWSALLNSWRVWP